ncbi:Uncharacterised protein [[Flavobacterium] thermophilum]|nr:hypothetical protein GARCT_00696 [Geobacillus sp. 12AMOR1]STO36327.1 Uncharacterised protein [[Flavobacterium] thermophilum]
MMEIMFCELQPLLTYCRFYGNPPHIRSRSLLSLTYVNESPTDEISGEFLSDRSHIQTVINVHTEKPTDSGSFIKDCCPLVLTCILMSVYFL